MIQWRTEMKRGQEGNQLLSSLRGRGLLRRLWNRTWATSTVQSLRGGVRYDVSFRYEFERLQFYALYLSINEEYYTWKPVSVNHVYYWPRLFYYICLPPRWTPCFCGWRRPLMRAAQRASSCLSSSARTAAASFSSPPTWPYCGPDPPFLLHLLSEFLCPRS